MRDRETGRHRIAFWIFSAMGYEAERPRMWRLEAFTSKSQPDWEAFLGALPGAPPRVVCDNDGGLTNAVRARFPDAELYLCEWHLRHALERLMGKLRSEEPQHRRGLRSGRPAHTPLSTSPLDALINPIRAAIQPRAHGLKNRERTNRMLMLMQLHANRQDDVRAYVRHIRGCLKTNQGRPSIARRAVIDSARDASLR